MGNCNCCEEELEQKVQKPMVIQPVYKYYPVQGPKFGFEISQEDDGYDVGFSCDDISCEKCKKNKMNNDTKKIQSKNV